MRLGAHRHRGETDHEERLVHPDPPKQGEHSNLRVVFLFHPHHDDNSRLRRHDRVNSKRAGVLRHCHDLRRFLLWIDFWLTLFDAGIDGPLKCRDGEESHLVSTPSKSVHFVAKSNHRRAKEHELR